MFRKKLILLAAVLAIALLVGGASIAWGGALHSVPSTSPGPDWTDMAINNIGMPISSKWDEGEQSFADNGTIVFCSGRQDLALAPGDPRDLYIATFNQETGTWNMPVNMGIPVNAAPVPGDLYKKGDDREPYITPDGNTIYFKSDRSAGPGNMNDIFVTHKVGEADASHPAGVWTVPEIVAPGVISTDAGNEHCPILSRDGNTMYFSANRPGGYGGYDEWYSTKDADGNWQAPVNLGPNVNTAGTEYHWTMNRSETTAIFSSNRPGGYGGMDLYITRRQEDGSWGPAINLGPAFNTAANDACAAYSANDRELTWFSNRTDNTVGGIDIFWSYSDNIPLISNGNGG